MNDCRQGKENKMSKKKYLFHGDYATACAEPGKLIVYENAYALVCDGVLEELTPVKPSVGDDVVEIDWKGKLIIPAFSDVHLHAVQYVTTGLGYDKELLPWLTDYTFPEEARFADRDYAARVFTDLAHDLWSCGTLHSTIFSSINTDATILLAEKLVEAGLSAFVGKVNMDRNGGVDLEETTEESVSETLRYLDLMAPFEGHGVKPILTPRFAPSCTPELMQRLGELSVERSLPVQSHVNENFDEIEWVRSLFPDSRDYMSVYHDFNLLPEGRTVMAHCIYNTDEELEMMRERDVLVAHCPASNANIASGIMPSAQLIDKGIRVGLGSDIGGGNRLFIGHQISLAMKQSRLRWVFTDRSSRIISFAEAFRMGTAGGGSFFGKTGAFMPGYAFDALVIDDSRLSRYRPLDITERLQRFIFVGDDRHIVARYRGGEFLPEPDTVIK